MDDNSNNSYSYKLNNSTTKYFFFLFFLVVNYVVIIIIIYMFHIIYTTHAYNMVCLCNERVECKTYENEVTRHQRGKQVYFF